MCGSLAGFDLLQHSQMRSVTHLLYSLVLLAVSGRVAPSWAQARPTIDISISRSAYPPTVAVRGVMTDKPFDELLRSGFPARLHVRAELWTEGSWVDDLKGQAAWDIVVHYDVIDQSYEVARRVGTTLISLGSYRQFADARSAVELAYSPNLPTPARGRKSYVLVQAELQTLQVSDLDELERWLKGEAAPAVKGKRSPASALMLGARKLASRLLGGEVRRLEARSQRIVF